MRQDIGIYRKIPLQNNVKRADGTTSKNKATITNIDVNTDFKKYKEGNYLVIKIGDSADTVKGEQEYIIKYKYDIGKDPLKDKDEFYFNLIGSEWDTSIENVSFKITMPKDFDESLLGFSSGMFGSTDDSNIRYQVKDNVITGMTRKGLQIGEALTVRLTLPEGYFVGAKNHIDIFNFFLIIFCCCCVGFVYFIWRKYGESNEIIETIEYYPPDGYNSAEVSFLYKGATDKEDIVSLLIYLANKGYIKIEDGDKKLSALNKNKGFKITKLKDYDGHDENEKMFLDGLFKSSGTIDFKKYRELKKEEKETGVKMSYQDILDKTASEDKKIVVTEDDLRDNCFYIVVDNIKKNIESKANKAKIFDINAMSKLKWVILTMVLIVIFGISKVIVSQNVGTNIFEKILAIAVLFPFVAGGPAWSMYKSYKKMKHDIVFETVFNVISIGLICMTVIDSAFSFITYMLAGIAIFILSRLMNDIPKRNQYGRELLGRIKGFKTFLETAEKPRLEMLVAENPEYFYDILPYTYALGVSDVWIKQFETISIVPPTWYDSTSDFDINNFSSFLDSTISSATSVITASSSSDSGSSSGGGSGGGGGGSW